MNLRFWAAVLCMTAAWPFSGSAQSVVPTLRLSILWEITVGNGDRTTTIFSAERDRYSSSGAIAYVARDESLSVLYRLYNGRDHMDSFLPGEGGYKTEGFLGSLWTNQRSVPGLGSLERLYNRSTGDHATSVAGDALGGYSVESSFSGKFGYTRFFNEGSSLAYYSAGGISEGSDSVAGGAVASWVWNNQEFINTDDYGRYLQSSVFFHDQTGGSAILYNPTEAGDHISGSHYGQRSNWHGSPVLNNQLTDGVHVTRSIPLEWAQQLGSGGVTEDSPVVYPGMQIGKNLTLDFAGLGPVGRYETHVVSPVPVASAKVEMPTGYLAAKFATFHTFDASTGQLQGAGVPDACTVMPPGVGRPSFSYAPPSGHGGVIVSDSSGSFAMGVYGVSQADGGSRGEPFHLWDFRNCGSTTKWNVVYNGPLLQGENVFVTYLISGSVADVAAMMRTLYDKGYK